MIIVLCGFSAAGKDTYLNLLLERKPLLKKIKTYTTRPKRITETDNDYFFVNEDEFFEKLHNGETTIHRAYNVIQNGKDAIWRYAIPKSELDDSQYDKIVILDSFGAKTLRDVYGHKVKIINFYCDDDVAIERVKKRGDDLAELIRRRNDDKRQFHLIKDIIDLNLNTNIDKRYEENIKKIDSYLGGIMNGGIL